MSRGPDCSFSHGHYGETLNLAREKGLEVGRYSEAAPPDLCVQHDVDFFVEPALRLAYFEASLAVQSTFFFRLSASGYNLFSGETLRGIHKLAELGHSVGLHVEPTSVTRSAPAATVSEVFDFVTRQTGIRLVGCSAHMPASFSPGCFEIPAVLDYSFNAPRFSGYRYISDSGGRWREGCFCNHLDNASRMPYLINTHPVWWFDQMPNEGF